MSHRRLAEAAAGGILMAMGATPQDAMAGDASPACDDDGIDVSLLLAHLEMTPAERVRNLVASNRFLHGVRERTLPAEVRRRLDAAELTEKWNAGVSDGSAR